MRFDRLNNMTGWVVWALATLVYFLTVEPTASFWDCGEFIASAYKLEVGHPPGAPFFMLLARFLMIPMGPETAALVGVEQFVHHPFLVLEHHPLGQKVVW